MNVYVRIVGSDARDEINAVLRTGFEIILLDEYAVVVSPESESSAGAAIGWITQIGDGVSGDVQGAGVVKIHSPPVVVERVVGNGDVRVLASDVHAAKTDSGIGVTRELILVDEDV